MDGNALSTITIMGLATAPASTAVTFNGKRVSHGVYNATSQTFFISHPEKPTSSELVSVRKATAGFGGGAIAELWIQV